MGDDDELVHLNPKEILSFQLAKNTSPKTILRISNISSHYVVFKVKTTQPSWYYVRPNQQIVKPGATEEVSIVLVDNECNRFISAHESGNEERLDKHRFLVQSKAISEGEFTKISAMSSTNRADEYTKLWGSGNKEDAQSHRLKVEFVYAEISSFEASSSSRSGGNIGTRNGRVASTMGGDAATNDPNSGGMGGLSDMKANDSDPDQVFAELQSLRKKYDDVIAYTVHLTAERDSLITQNEETRRELAREAQRRKKDDTGPRGGNTEKSADNKKVAQQGFTLFSVMFFALLSFLLGIYIRMGKEKKEL